MGMEAETLEYLEYLPQDHHHPRVSRGQHLNSLRSEGGNTAKLKMNEERRERAALKSSHLPWLLRGWGMSQTSYIFQGFIGISLVPS